MLCLVYSVDDTSSFMHISSYWMPTIRRALNSDGVKNALPVIIAGNKVLREPT